MEFLLGQRLFNNIFCAAWIIPYFEKQPIKLNKRKNKINFIQEN